MRFVDTVDIDAAPDRVFRWIDEPERGKRWSASIVGGEFINSTPERVGSTFREVVGREGRTLEMRGVITEYVPNERFAVHVESERHTADVRFTLSHLSGHTKLTREVDLHLKGAMKYGSIFLRPMLRKNLQTESEKEFSTLKRLCEQEELGQQ